MTDTTLSNLVIHELTKEQYEALTPEQKQLYLVTDETPLDSSDIETTITSSSTNEKVAGAKSVYDYHDSSKLDKNTAITGGTHSKITYDSKGLVTSGTDLTLSDLGVTASSTELNYTSGVTSNIQTQLDAKQANLTSDNAGDNITISASSVTHNLPVAYQEVEYLQSNGAQYIDTGVILSTDTAVTVDFKFNIMQNNNSIFGSWNYSTSPRKTWNITQYSSEYYFGINTVSEYHTGSPDTSKHTIVATESNGQYIFNLDGQTLATGTADAVGNTLNCYLFCRNVYASGATNFLNGNIYRFIIVKNNTTVREMYPCYRKSDNKPGMYDITNDVFYTNANTAASVDFILGPDLQAITKINALTGLTATTNELNILDGITATTQELNYTDGVTSNIQDQLDDKSEVTFVDWE